MTSGFAISSVQGTGSVAVTKPMEWTQQQMVHGVSATKNWPRPLQGTGEASRGRLVGGGTAVRVEVGGWCRPGSWCVAMTGPRGCTWLTEERCVQAERVMPTALGDRGQETGLSWAPGGGTIWLLLIHHLESLLLREAWTAESGLEARG